MNGRLMQTSRFALAALAVTLMGSSAMAADLGGNCCADLEERIAELEATTVRKGNRKVSLQISGFVGHAVMWWDDGRQSDMYVGDAGNLTSRFRLRGEAKINPELTAGFLYEFAVTSNSLGSANQLNGGDDLGVSGGCNQATAAAVLPGTNNNSGCAHLRDSTVWLRHNRLGMVKIGYGSTATDNLVLIDLGNMGTGATPDHALHAGGMILRGNNGVFGGATGVTWTGAIRGHESWDTSRRNHVLYETPTLHGFTVQGAIAEDNFWDVALRYAGEFNGIRVAFGLGYIEDSEFNATHQLFDAAGALCNQNCNVKVTDLKGSASILHIPTGLFITGSAGERELSGISNIANGAYAGPDLRYWHLAGGVARNYFGIGNTVAYVEYGEHKGGLAQAAFLAGSAANHCFNSTAAQNCDSTVTNWGLGLVQYVDAAAMELFATYKNYSLDSAGFAGGSAHLNKGVSGVHDLSIFMVGSKINF